MTTDRTQTDAPEQTSVDDFAEHVFQAAVGAVELLTMYAGDRLGWYRSLADDGPATSAELAARTSTHERYVREWLEQQAVFSVLTTDPAQGPAERRYALTPAAREVLTDQSSLAYLGPLARMLAGSAIQLPALLEAYAGGGGVSWAQLGDDARQSQADMNRPWYEHRLAPALAGVDHLHGSLSQPSVTIADVGCGAGWSAIALALAYPEARVVGIDVDAPSVEMGTRNAADAGVGDRVSFELADGRSAPAHGRFDAAFAFECIHDMPQPVSVLAGIREAVKPGAPVVIMDEAVADEFTAPGDDVEKIMYGFSLFVCLPDGMSSQPSVGTGTMMRRGTLEAYATEAGFSGVDVLPIEDFGFWRFYQLRH